MYAETEGIVLKQIKIAGGRRMLVVFTKRYGKISAGTSIGEGGKNRAALALRPFTYGKYQINKKGNYYHINGCETMSSHYSIGEDIDKYLCASFGMEFTEKLLPEEAPAPKLFVLLTEFLDRKERLIYYTKFGIVNVIKFLKQSPLSQLENLALDDDTLEWIKRILKSYIEYHLDISCLKSEECMGHR